MIKCKFTGVEEVPGCGTYLFKNDGTILYFSDKRSRLYWQRGRKVVK